MVKVSTKKKASEKKATATKASPKKKAAPVKAAPAKPAKDKANKLGRNKAKILEALAKSKVELTRADLIEKTGITNGFAALLGAPTGGAPSKGTLEGDGLVVSAAYEGNRSLFYKITAAGRAALQAAK